VIPGLSPCNLVQRNRENSQVPIGQDERLYDASAELPLSQLYGQTLLSESSRDKSQLNENFHCDARIQCSAISKLLPKKVRVAVYVACVSKAKELYSIDRKIYKF